MLSEVAYPVSVTATAYCLRGTMADGTVTRLGSAASNRHRLGTVLLLRSRGPGGRRRFVVRDRIGWGTDLDLWASSCREAVRFGRRAVSYRIVR